MEDVGYSLKMLIDKNRCPFCKTCFPSYKKLKEHAQKCPAIFSKRGDGE